MKSHAKFEKPMQTHFANQLCLVKTLQNLKAVANSFRNTEVHFATLQIPMVPVRNTNSQCENKRSLKQTYLKTSKASFHFTHPISHCENPAPSCESTFSSFDAPRPTIRRGDLYFLPHFGHGTHQMRSYGPFIIS